jgi:putative peptide maturation system protein
MKRELQNAVVDALDYLVTLIQEGVRPEEARKRFRLLRERHLETGMDLLWEEGAYDHALHYDTLLHLPGGGTVSLSFCPDRALPWLLRGVHRWSEADLVRVNNIVLKVDQAIACLDFIWDEAQIINRLVNVCLIQETLDKDPVLLTDAELQCAMDGFRRAHKLYTTEETYRWLERHGMTQERLERLVADEASVAKLRDRVTASQVEEYFEVRRADFDTAWIARIECSDEESAHRIYEQIRTGEVDFYEAACRRFLAASERAEHSSGEAFAVLQRKQTPSKLGAALFAAAPGEVLGPMHTGGDSAVIRVLSFAPARLDERTRSTIKKILFEDWLAERRQAATIEWYWGDASRTSQACTT